MRAVSALPRLDEACFTDSSRTVCRDCELLRLQVRSTLIGLVILIMVSDMLTLRALFRTLRRNANGESSSSLAPYSLVADSDLP
jgi:hypothetical protein